VFNKRYFKLSLFISLVLIIVVLVLTSACSSGSTSTATNTATSTASAQVTTIKGTALFPTEDYGYIILSNSLLPKLNQQLEGKGIKLELYAPDMLVPSSELFDALSKGTVGFTLSDFSFDSQFIPETIVAFSLPRAWRNIDQDITWWDKYGAASFYADSYAQHNIHFTYPLPEARNSLMTKNKINSLADLKGQKIWCSPPHDTFIALLGAEATTLPPPDIFMGLQLGTLDGVTYSEPELKTMNLYQVVKYLNWPAIQDIVNVNFNFNMDTWKKFSPEVQNIIDTTVKDFAREFSSQYQAAANTGIDFFKSNGGTVVEFSGDLLTQYTAKAFETWDIIAKGSDRTAQAVQMVKDFMKGENIQ
jgi:TRAP-type C4-dicarboxylate transport system substrate-binding protein